MHAITPTTFKWPFSTNTHYYVEMRCNLATPINNYDEDQLVGNLEDPILELET
jgi:hypothetical protein